MARLIVRLREVRFFDTSNISDSLSAEVRSPFSALQKLVEGHCWVKKWMQSKECSMGCLVVRSTLFHHVNVVLASPIRINPSCWTRNVFGRRSIHISVGFLELVVLLTLH
ncbi:hypothetical protein RvY_00095 [Ramazzottius varieornatus]|uniref:Uncharacterized protein n=1 Tax=Ramazzottius varieornatus TaxID=947166 RepID=A0A1D1UHW8_RAMVA|nr:hypothetical protein RvY_00095 [Ramazzottius varieornatus]